ncbi:MAG: nucleotidyltransferase family protein [Lachnospiraceae bacterium]|nr:nucleotidyltransferase family protein [Lachnospiraceae bacterium]
MRTVGIIAEYNPFHTGHKYHIQEAKKLADADYAVVVMSPDFVQRGEPAIFDKYTRARMALQCGADLVVELPVCYATGSAEYFAEGAVRMLDALGVVNALCFGAEPEDVSAANARINKAPAQQQSAYVDAFRSVAALLLEEPEPYKEMLRKGLRRGMTFPKARAKAAAYCLSDTESAETLLSTPNNILGVEYCKALQRISSSITPVPVLRKGSLYSNQDLAGDYCSAGAIRTCLRGKWQLLPTQGAAPSGADYDPALRSELSRYIPAACAESFWDASRTPVFPDELLPVLTQKLLCGNINFPSAENFADSYTGKSIGHPAENRFDDIHDISPALSARMEKLRFNCVGKSFDETVALIKTKQITETHVRRALLHLVLDIRKADMVSWRTNGGVFYAHLLGFRQDAAPLLHEIKIRSALPLISKAAHAPGLLSDMGLQMWNQDTAASHLYRSLRTLRYGTPFRSEYEISPIHI